MNFWEFLDRNGEGLAFFIIMMTVLWTMAYFINKG